MEITNKNNNYMVKLLSLSMFHLMNEYRDLF